MEQNNNLQFIKGVGEKRAAVLKDHGIADVNALLQYYPRSYLDFKNTINIVSAPIGENCCVKARVMSDVREHYIRKNMTVYKFTATDNTGVLSITVFNNRFITKTVKKGSEYLFFGKIDGGFTEKTMASPIIKPLSYQKILPKYTAIGDISSTVLSGIIGNALKTVSIAETLPESILEKYGLERLDYAVRQIHFPSCQAEVDKARKRLAFDELLTLQLGMAMKRAENEKKGGYIIEQNFTKEFCSLLPFTLTGQQQDAVNDCILDMKSGKPMARLLQGDVGSGKTAVAAALAFTVVKNGYQCVFMAPTEVLAEQHFKNLTELFGGKLNILLLTGSATAKNKRLIKEQIKSGEADIVIGTHAVIEDDVKFRKLGLVITDEQHRFGVRQRTVLTEKGNNPHLLVMSATPIPRTMALIIYGDLDISIINEMPRGRQTVKTYAVNSTYRQRISTFIKKTVDNGKQAYIVCPLIGNEGENALNLTSAEELYSEVKDEDFKGYSVGLLHGKMKPAEKNRVMKEFAENKISILISTTVIEVGIDVKNATVMVIENADRFGLSQLHQLRGRVGRGKDPSTCVLISDSKSKTARERLKIICDNSDGFKISDYDLKMRGPGDFCGRRQHGLPELKIADLTTDMEIFRMSAEAAQKIVNSDKTLSRHPELLSSVKRLYATAKQYGEN